MGKVPVTVVILTFNEEIHIRRAIENVIDWADEVIVLDSGSNDATVAMSEELGAKVIFRKFDTYSNQRNFGIKEVEKRNEWMLFLDADEILYDEIKDEIRSELNDSKFDGYYMKRRFYFQGRWIKYGGYYPTNILRLFRKSKAICEREINEHIKVDGELGQLKNDFADINLRGIKDWIDKHNRYADLEAKEIFLFEQRQEKGESDEFAKLFGTQAQSKRWIREKIWNPLMPKLFRAFVYYSYRYIFKFGFLDGKWGFIYHFLHGLWFYFLIDVKYLELKSKYKEVK